MQYSNYDMKNNVHATLSTAVSSVATTIQLTSWQWSRFWTTFPQIATLESFDENWKVIKREIVKITWRSGDNLTVVRAFAPCPENDDANSQTQNAISFNADDTISLYIPKEIFDKIADSLNDIYDNWTNNMRTELVSWLQVQVNPWNVMVWSAYYDFAGWTITLTDNATNYLEIDEDWNLANNTTGRNDENTKLAIITTASGSVTNIQDWRLWTVWWKIGGVNIHDLTEKQTLSPDDEFIISDSENIRQNKKIKAKNLVWFQSCICWENIEKWDIVAFENYMTPRIFNLWTNGTTTWNTINNNEKFAQMIYGSWFSSKKLSFVWKLTNTSTTLNIRIETDNNGDPSWTLADINATHNLLTTEATTTEWLINIEFDSEFTLTKWEKYRVVFDGWSTSNFNISNEIHNHTVCKYGTNDYSAFVENDYYVPSLVTSWSGAYRNDWTMTFTITPTINYLLTEYYCDWNMTNIIISKDWNTLYTWSWSAWQKISVNIYMEENQQYDFSVSINTRITWNYPQWDLRYIWDFPFSISNIISSNWWIYMPNLWHFWYIKNYKSLLIESELFSNYLRKATTNLIYKKLWISIGNYNEWEIATVAINNYFIFSNKNFIPWERYIYNWTDFVLYNTQINWNNIIVWLAIDNNTLLLELKQNFIYSWTSKAVTVWWNGFVSETRLGWTVNINNLWDIGTATMNVFDWDTIFGDKFNIFFN